MKNVQRWATKLMDGFHDTRYSERLKKLILASFFYRRAQDNIIENSNISTPTTIVHYLKISDLETVLVKNRLPTGMESTQRWRERSWSKFYLFPNNQNLSNELPEEILYAKSIDFFRNKLDEAWKVLPITFYEQERFIEAQICKWIYNS